jgi:hypothetical protein
MGLKRFVTPDHLISCRYRFPHTELFRERRRESQAVAALGGEACTRGTKFRVPHGEGAE